MQKTHKFSIEEVAAYLVDRIGRGHGQGGTKAGPALDGDAVERLAGMVREKQDLLRQVIADLRLLGQKEGSMSQDGMLAALDESKEAEDLDVRALVRLIAPTQGVESSVEEAQERLREIDGAIRELAGDPEVLAGYRKRVEQRIAVIRAARNTEGLQKLIEKCDLARLRLVAHRNSADLTLSGADVETIRKYDAICGNARGRIERSMGREEVYYEAKRRALLEYRRQLMTGGFVRTESVRNQIMRVFSHVQLGTPVFLRGHLGVGKTEMALHVSRAYLGVDPEFISGSEEATKYDIYGRTQIGVGSDDERLREFRKRMEEYRRINPGAGAEELGDVERRYYEAIVVQGQATSFFQYGPLVQAMRQGKPLIIDELDSIPHSILIRINHVLTRRAGDTIKVQENGGEEITVKKGFCVLATGNVRSARYKREDLDAAFLSRWWSEDVRYPPPNETYEILLAALIDRRGDLQMNGQCSLDDLKRLTEAAAEIQRIFTGERIDYLGEGADAARGTPAGLKKTVLSLRNLWNIVRPWKAHNYDQPIDHYILNEFIRPAMAEDQIYLIQLFCRFRFFKDWTVGRFDMPGLTEAKLLAFQGKQSV